MYVIDPWHWMDPNTVFPQDNHAVRRNLLRVARIIEYGAGLQPDQARLTLVECAKRPGRKPCPGFLVVRKEADGSIYAECTTCRADQYLIHNWEETLWAGGPAEPLSK